MCRGEGRRVAAAIHGDVERREGREVEHALGEAGEHGVVVGVGGDCLQAALGLGGEVDLEARRALVSDLLREAIVIGDGDILALQPIDGEGRLCPSVEQVQLDAFPSISRPSSGISFAILDSGDGWGERP